MDAIVYLHMAASVAVLLRVAFFLSERTHERRTWHMLPVACVGLGALAVGVEPLFDAANITQPQALFMLAAAVCSWIYHD